MKKLLFALLITVHLSTFAESRQSLVERYFSAIARKDYATAAQCIRQADLYEFKNTFTSVYRLEAQNGKRDLLDATFGSSARLEDALYAKPEDLFSRAVTYLMAATASTVGNTQFYSTRVLGEIPEGTSLVHEVVRSDVQVGPYRTSKVEVISLAAEGASWKIVLPDQLRNYGAMLKQQMERRPQR